MRSFQAEIDVLYRTIDDLENSAIEVKDLDQFVLRKIEENKRLRALNGNLTDTLSEFGSTPPLVLRREQL